MGKGAETKDALDDYRRTFSGSNGNMGQHIEIRAMVTPGDEIAELRMCIPSTLLPSSAEHVSVTVSSRRKGVEGNFAPALTELTEVRGVKSILAKRVQDEEGNSRTEIDLSIRKGQQEPVEFHALAWEVLSPPTGDAPYVKATLDLVVEVPSLPKVPVILTVVTPGDSAPRSVQGAHVLAYPSRTFDGARYLPIFFRRDRPIRISAEFGPTNSTTDIWIGFAKLAGAAALVAFLGSLKRSQADTEQILATLASLAALVGLAGEALRQYAELRIYHAVGRRLQGALLTAQSFGIVLIALSAVRLGNSGEARTLSAVVPLSYGLAIVAAITAAGGLILHRLGYWHQFVCDYEGCRSVLRIRKGRSECHYTGRVFCDAHIDTVCGSCVYGGELGRSESSVSPEQFDYRLVRCRRCG